MKTFARRIGASGMRLALAVSLGALAASGCGGGGSGGAGATAPVTAIAAPSTTANAPSATTTTSAAPNVATITIDAGPAGAGGTVNMPFVSVTVCAPGNASSCQTVDHILLDTGSSGLRLMASVLSNRAALTPQTRGSSGPYVECAQFADSYAWGSVKLADVTLAGETAASLPVQVIGDPDFADVPTTCSSAGTATNTVASLGANGLLGVGSFREDCGDACVGTAVPGTYYLCTQGGGCSPSDIALAQQVANPVAHFPSDNNGLSIRLPAIADGGAINVTGSLVFGIGTSSNNALGSARAYGLDASGNFSTTFNGHLYAHSFIDSGSNFFFFNSTALPNCSGTNDSTFYCPAATESLTAFNQGTNGVNGAVSFSIANAEKQFSNNPSATAFSNIGAGFPALDGFDWGLPFLYGRNVFMALEGAATIAGTGPYVAY